MVIRSLLTIQGTLHSLDEIRLWIENRNRSIHVSISPVPFLPWITGLRMKMVL